MVQQENGAYVEAETEAAMSMPGTKVSATIEDVIDGFLQRKGMTKEDYTPSYSDVTVAFNGSTVVEVRYTLKDLHSASFYEQETGTFLGMAYYREGDTITIPTSIQREGYAPVFADLGEGETPTMEDENVDLNITWVLADNGYTVEHYLQGEDGEYVLDRRTSVPGEAGDPVSDTIQSQLLKLEGYREIRYDEDAVIGEDGDTVVEVYYDRYVATFVNDSTEYITPDKEVGKVYFLSGSPAITPPVVTSTDSNGEEVTVTGWTYTLEDGATGSGIPETMPAQDITFTALWSAEWAQYTVQYHIQNTTGDGYTDVAQTETHMGTVNTAATEYDGLTGEYAETDKFTPKADEDVTITADGSTVLHVYYDRVPYTITYHLNKEGASFATGVSGTATYRYGAALSLLTNRDVSCPNMVFGGWYTDADGSTRFEADTMPVGNVDLYAKWTEGYTVTVNHYKQIADSGEYGTPATEAIAVPTGTTSISSKAKDYTADHYQLAECKVVIGSNTTTLTGDEAAGPIDLSDVTDTSQITVNYYYDLETFGLTVKYTASTYGTTDGVNYNFTTSEEERTISARFGQTLNSAFTELAGGINVRFGYDLAGFTDNTNSDIHYDLDDTMPAKALTVTATWTPQTLTLTFDYDGRMDLVEELEENGISVTWETDSMISSSYTFYLTYGQEAYLPTADEVPGLVSFAGVKAGENLCTNMMFYYQGGSDIIWDRGGDGTEEKPIMIYSASGLKAYHSYVNPNGLTDDGKYYQLGANLDLSRVSASEGDFEGILHLDGAGHTISNYSGSRGLFTALHDGSTVSDLTIENAHVSAYEDFVGILADEVLGIIPESVDPDHQQTIPFGIVTLTDIIVTNSSVSGTNAGGLVGRVGPKDAFRFEGDWLKANGPYLYLTDCSVDESVTVTGTTADGSQWAGPAGEGRGAESRYQRLRPGRRRPGQQHRRRRG